MASYNFSFANLSNLPLLEQVYEQYLREPLNIDPSWRIFFDGMQFGSTSGLPGAVEGQASPDLRIHALIHAYRTYGHVVAKSNPLLATPPEEPPMLSLQTLGFKPEELTQKFPTCGFLKEEMAPLQSIIDALKKTYCGTVSFEYMNLEEPKIEEWLQKKIEPGFPLHLSEEEKLRILHFLNKAELFESFIHMKYVGQTRFSLEGGESMIPLMHALLEHGADLGIAEAVLGMAHRGRLNILANILNKSYGMIFSEFEDVSSPDIDEPAGDVKYHKGISGTLTTAKGLTISVRMAPNPSHLESINPAIEGEVRALQEMRGKQTGKKSIVPILIHGDAAVAGQGVVYETMQMEHLTGYSTGGTIHIVLNNQIGFTTLPKDSRSTRYCTDIARSFGSPVFHVNAEDPEGCVAVAKLAIELRQLFECDVFIDFMCYRKYGHNEGDEPTFTQPKEYQRIKEKKPIREMYYKQLIEQGLLSQQKVDEIENQLKTELQGALAAIKSTPPEPSKNTEGRKEDVFKKQVTAVSQETLKHLAQVISTPPTQFHIHPKIQRLLQERLKMVNGDPALPTIDWGMGENLTYATLVSEGIAVRLSGQDCRRGTFSHRHAMWVDQENAQKYFPLSHIANTQAPFDAFNSFLSELAVLGFEFGYSAAHPKALVIWEAQYGDFANGAQVIIDQYIASSEQKWMQNSNITLMLPHGYEGQGPEHSSARIERFLQLCGDDNLFVVNYTTPAQLFHALRRQAKRTVKKPMILFTPKKLLRYAPSFSSLNDFSQGSFEEILDDKTPAKNTQRLLLCSGRIYYDLIDERTKRGEQNTTIVRIEQLYPLDEQRLKSILLKYEGFEQCFWVQEEHHNAGAWQYMRPILNHLLGGQEKILYVGRAPSASTATGSAALHKRQYSKLMDDVFGRKKS